MSPEPQPGGRHGPAAGTTAVSDLGRDTDLLTYRGYAIEDLADHGSFEEVAYLLLRGRLPDRPELDAYRARLRSLRALPPQLCDLLESIPDSGSPLAVMDALRTSCSFLGSLEPERDSGQFLDVADRLVAMIPGMMVARYRFSTEGVRINTETAEETTAGHILAMLFGQPPAELHRRCLDVSLVLYADLAFNASTFACRVCAATQSDLYSCVTTGIATLRGPLHGGASVSVMGLLDRFGDPQEARDGVRGMLAQREKVMGFGHAVYRLADPRTAILKRWARRLADEGSDSRLFAVADAAEQVMCDEKRLFANVDFYTACCYRLLDIPLPLYSPLFVCARIAGWSAHVSEQRTHGRLIHPVADYDGPPPRPFVPLERRGTC